METFLRIFYMFLLSDVRCVSVDDESSVSVMVCV